MMVISTLAPEVQATLLRQWEPIQRNQLHYLVTWSTRGRKGVLRRRHVRALEHELQTICRERGFPLVEICAGTDHVHVLIALRSTQSVASVVRELKGRSGMSLIAQFPELRVWLSSNLVWDDRYSLEMVSLPRLEPVRARLRALHGGHDDLAAAG